MVEYKVFFKIKGMDIWRTHEFNADNDFAAQVEAGKYINEKVKLEWFGEIERWGLEKIVRTRLI